MHPHSKFQSPPCAHAVLQYLSSVLLASRSPVVSPCGVVLQPVFGCYAIGQQVLSPGIDNCMPAAVVEVMAVGSRDDLEGIWCLLRNLGDDTPSALLREDMLRPLMERLG
jgi:hypothetical protein